MLRRYYVLPIVMLVFAASFFAIGCQKKDTDSVVATGAGGAQEPGTAVPSADTPEPTAGTDASTIEPAADDKMATEQEAPANPPGASASTPATAGTEWGHLQGRFVFEGSVPQQKPVKVTSDLEYCGPHNPLDESVIVHPDNLGLANVLIGLFLGRGDAPPAVHSSYDVSARNKVTIDNLKCCFVPHVALLRTSQTLQILNSDKIAHNTKIDTFVNTPINPTLPAGGSLEQRFDKAERLPARVSCSIHPWMTAWLMIRSDPYAAISDRDGRFEIKNLPAGTWTFQVWHERVRYVTEVTRDGAATQWSKGRFTVDIPAGQALDMGDLKIQAKEFGDL